MTTPKCWGTIVNGLATGATRRSPRIPQLRQRYVQRHVSADLQTNPAAEIQRKYFVKLILDKSQSNLDKLQITELCFGLTILSWASVINGP